MLRLDRRDDRSHEVTSFGLHDDVASKAGKVATAKTALWNGVRREIHPLSILVKQSQTVIGIIMRGQTVT